MSLQYNLLLCTTIASAVVENKVTISKGHTIDPIYHTVIKNGVPFTDHTITSQVLTTNAPAGAQASDLTVGTVSHIKEGKYRFSIKANASAKVCDNTGNQYYEIKLTDATRRSRVLTPDLKVFVKDVCIVAISFKDAAGSDARDVYDSYYDQKYASSFFGGYEWSVGQRNDPAAYFNNSVGPKKLRVKLHGAPNTTVTVSATGNFGGVSAKSVAFGSDGVAIVNDFQIVNNPASAAIGVYNFPWVWTIAGAGGGSSTMTTTHKLYITAADTAASPAHGNAYAEMYEVGCNANGTLAGIRAEFSDRQVSAIGKTFTYYGPKFKARDENFATNDVHALMRYGDGDCDSWAQFYRDVLALQEIESTPFRIYSKYNDFPSISVLPGLSGQGPTNPAGEYRFNWHAMVTFDSGRFDDPSYGNADYTGKIPWEDDAFGPSGPNPPQGGCLKTVYVLNQKGEIINIIYTIKSTPGEDTTTVSPY